MNQEITDPLELLNLHNDLIGLQTLRNRLEHDRLVLLKYEGDPIVDDKALYDLRLLSAEIYALKRTMNSMEMKLGRMRSAYHREISIALGAPLTVE